MGKVTWRPGNMIYPLPAVMVSCGETEEEYNIITIAWTGTICSDPPMCYISVRPNRHSYDILKRTKEYVINITTQELAKATDWCGVRSGRKYNKFSEMSLTPGKAQKVNAPIIEEAPLHLECKVKEIVPLGTHDMFISEIVNVQADERYLDEETGTFHLDQANPICYSHGQYHSLGKKLGKFGFSVEKKKRKKKRCKILSTRKKKK
ncbi:MAG: flavin reductase family protein [Desulfobacterales bacterium]|nr:flavin reductase family protein [Desulfobacterales bacterium]